MVINFYDAMIYMEWRAIGSHESKCDVLYEWQSLENNRKLFCLFGKALSSLWWLWEKIEKLDVENH